MRQTIGLAVGIVLLAATAAGAEILEKATNTGINAGLGIVECPKAWWDEASRGGLRGVVGAVATGPVMCGANVVLRYFGVVADVVTLPWGDNLIKPNALDHKPPLRLP
jgi:hypothetical protein